MPCACAISRSNCRAGARALATLRRVQESIEKFSLGGIDFAARQFFRKEFRAIDFGKDLPFAGARRLLQFEGVGPKDKVVRQIALHRPGVHRLAAFLSNFAEWKTGAGGFEA